MNIKLKTKAIVVGKVVKPHGISGGVKVKSFTENLDDFLAYNTFLLDCSQGGTGALNKQGQEQEQELTVSHILPLNGMFVVYFNGVDSIDQAEGFRGMLLKVSRETIVLKKNLSIDDVLIDDLIGFQVYEEMIHLGYVEGYYESGINGLYLIKKKIVEDTKSMDIAKQDKKNSGKDFYIPCDLDFYQKVDFEQKKIFLKPDSVVK